MINNLELKLKGNIPVTREDLFELVSSWGRYDLVLTNDKIRTNSCKPKECYDLSNLDVSQIENLSYIFRESMFNGDLSKWNVSNCKDMRLMFSYSDFNNDSIKFWDISNVINLDLLFYENNFDKDLSYWNFDNVIFCEYVVFLNNEFKNKYNNGKEIPCESKEFKEWFEKNREKIRNLNTSKNEVLNFFSFDKDLEKGILYDK